MDVEEFTSELRWGLCGRELVMLELADFGTNPHAREFGELGVLYVRWGKGLARAAPRSAAEPGRQPASRCSP